MNDDGILKLVKQILNWILENESFQGSLIIRLFELGLKILKSFIPRIKEWFAKSANYIFLKKRYMVLQYKTILKKLSCTVVLLQSYETEYKKTLSQIMVPDVTY